MIIRAAVALTLFGGAAAGQAGGTSDYRPLSGTGLESPPMIASRAMELPNGSVVVSGTARQATYVALLDSSLRPVRNYLDTLNRELPGRRGTIALIRARSDTVLFVDLALQVFKRITPSGDLGRIVPFPDPQAVLTQTSLGTGNVALDDRSRLIYAGQQVQMGFRDPVARTGRYVVRPDSIPLVRTTMERWLRDSVRHEPASFDTVPARFRQTDTIAWLRQQTSVLSMDSEGRNLIQQLRPAGFDDLWGVLASGEVVIVRGDSYRLDRISSNGTMRQATVPHHRISMTAADKRAVLARIAQDMANSPSPFATATRSILPKENEIPDALAPVRPTKLLVDEHDRLWIPRVVSLDTRTSPSFYDVVTPAGQVIDRVRLPDNTSIVGFGKQVIYLRRYDSAADRGSLIRLPYPER